MCLFNEMSMKVTSTFHTASRFEVSVNYCINSSNFRWTYSQGRNLLERPYGTNTIKGCQ